MTIKGTQWYNYGPFRVTPQVIGFRTRQSVVFPRLYLAAGISHRNIQNCSHFWWAPTRGRQLGMSLEEPFPRRGLRLTCDKCVSEHGEYLFQRSKKDTFVITTLVGTSDDQKRAPQKPNTSLGGLKMTDII